MSEDAIFRPLRGGRYEATPAAGGPWNDRHCHGGAPAALLCAALEGLDAAAPMDLARLTVDLLRPVPVGAPLEIVLGERQERRKVEFVTAELRGDGGTLARASAVKVRSGKFPLPPPAAGDPEEARPLRMPGGFSQCFTILPAAGAFGEPGPASAWFRLNSALVAGRETSPLARAVAASDFGSGIAHALDLDAWSFPSLDLSVSIVRPPVGCWTLVESAWLSAEGGRTSCRTSLSDGTGPFGLAVQTVFLEARAQP